MSTLIVYPAAGTGGPSVDGYAQHGANDDTWANIIGGVGTIGSALLNHGDCLDMIADGVVDTWRQARRMILLFDASAIVGAAINSATLEIKGFGKTDNFTIPIAPNINIYSSAPASNGNVVAGDFDSLGSTAFSTAITHAGWAVGSFNAFSLNASGISHVQTATDGDGIVKLGCRDPVYDVAASAPNWEANKTANFAACYADEAGTTSDPKLTIDYKLGGGSKHEYYYH